MTMIEQTTLSEDDKWPLKLAAYVTIGAGILALLSPFYAGIAVTLLLGANFLISGVLEAFAAFRAQRWGGTIGLLLLALVSVIAGLIIFAHPLLGLATLTLFCIASIFVAGIAKLFWAFKVPENGGRWMLLLSGVLSIVLAAMLYSQFPLSAEWAFGVLIGVNLVIEGVTLLAFLKQSG